MPKMLIFFGCGSDPGGASYSTIWQSDGTTDGTSPLTGDGPDFGFNSGIQPLRMPGPILLDYGDVILAQDNIGGNSLLFVYYKATKNPTSINYMNNTSATFNPQDFVVYNGVVYFNGTVSPNNELFSGNVSNNGTEFVIDQISNTGLNPQCLAVAFGKLFFSGFDGQNNVLYSWGGVGQPAPVGVDITNHSSYMASPIGTAVAFDWFPGLPRPTIYYPVFMNGTDSTGT
jgi:hypothetical protein